MEIVNTEFEKPLIFIINGQVVELIAFKTHEDNLIKIGVNAPKTIAVNREEILLKVKAKQHMLSSL